MTVRKFTDLLRVRINSFQIFLIRKTTLLRKIFFLINTFVLTQKYSKSQEGANACFWEISNAISNSIAR